MQYHPSHLISEKNKISQSDSIQYTKLINFKSDMVEFSVNTFKNWVALENKEEKGVYIFDRKISISPDYKIGFFSFLLLGDWILELQINL